MILLIMLFILGSCRAGSCTTFEIFPGQSIQSAVEQSLDADTILIHDGAYAESVVLHGKTITLGSLYLLDGDTAHIASTVIYPDEMRLDTNSCFVYCSFETTAGRLVGLTMRDGQGTLYSQTGYQNGGAVYVWRSSVSIEHCSIEFGNATLGGGLFVENGAFTRMVRLNACSFRNCFASSWGGAVYASLCSLSVDSSEFLDNNGRDGGITLLQNWGRIEHVEFRRCHGFEFGALYFGADGWISDCVFDSNGATSTVGVAHLGTGWGNVDVFRNRFTHKTDSFAAIFLDGQYNPIHFWGNVVEENENRSDLAGIVLANGASSGEVAYNIIRNNLSNLGGVLWNMDDSHVRYHHNLIEHNTSLNPARPSVLASIGYARPTLDSNIIVGNTGPTVDYVSVYPVAIHAENNYWGDPSGPYHPRLNPNGRGDTLLSDSVLFIPWLTAPPDTHLPENVPHFERPEISATWKLVAVYPNPFNSSLRIILAGFARDDFRITLHNLLGQEVGEIHRGPLTGGELIYQAPPSLATGVYFVRASSRTNVETRKVVFLK